jgi:hypothetical protein
MTHATNLFSRYKQEKVNMFMNWLNTTHGQHVYALFKRFAQTWKDAGNDKCSATLIINRLRWECATIGKYQGYKIRNEFAPMMARQLVTDCPEFASFFAFHADQPATI